MRRFDAVIFDFDGVLVQSIEVKTRAFAALYSHYGPDIEAKVIAHHLAHGGMSRYEKFHHYHTVLLGQPLSAEDEATLAEQFSILVEDAVVAAPWMRGAREFVETHYRALSLFVASATPHEELRRIIDRRGMTSYFVDAKGAPASKVEILRGFVREHNLQGERTLMIGDARADYEGARRAGLPFLGVAAAPADLFPAETPVLSDLTTLAQFLATPRVASAGS